MQNLKKGLQRVATEQTVQYINQHMRHIDSVNFPEVLLKEALTRAEQGGGRLICEFGVYSGKTINHIASQTRETVYGFDSFQGLPERWRDGIGEGSFRQAQHPDVLTNVVLIEGWFHESLPPFLEEHPGDATFLHIDCDLYSSTKTIFDLMRERIKPGCVIVFDEYFNHPNWLEGEYKAFQEFISNTGLSYEYIGYNRFHEQVAVRIID